MPAAPGRSALRKSCALWTRRTHPGGLSYPARLSLPLFTPQRLRNAVDKRHQTSSHPGDRWTAQQHEADWTQLEGRAVQIYDRGQLIARGRVDAVTSDGSILWLAPNGVLTRSMVENVPGRSITVLTKQ